MLPFGSVFGEAIKPPSDFEHLHPMEHESVSTWVIENDGSVKISHTAILASSELSTSKSKDIMNATVLLIFTRGDGALAEALEGNWNLKDLYGEMNVDLNEWVRIHASSCYAVCLGSYDEYDDDDNFVGNCFGVLLRRVREEYLVKVGMFFVHHKGNMREEDVPLSTKVDWIVV